MACIRRPSTTSKAGEEGLVRASLDKIAQFTGTRPARLAVAGLARNA